MSTIHRLEPLTEEQIRNLLDEVAQSLSPEQALLLDDQGRVLGVTDLGEPGPEGSPACVGSVCLTPG